MKIVKRKKGGFYGLGNASREGNEVIIPGQTFPPPQDLERTTVQTMNTIAPQRTVKLGESVGICGGMSLESMLLIGGAVAIVGIIAHYATK